MCTKLLHSLKHMESNAWRPITIFAGLHANLAALSKISTSGQDSDKKGIFARQRCQTQHLAKTCQNISFLFGLLANEPCNEPMMMSRDAIRWNKFSVPSNGFHHPVDEHVRRHLGHPYLGTNATADVLGLFAAQDFVDPERIRKDRYCTPWARRFSCFSLFTIYVAMGGNQ